MKALLTKRLPEDSGWLIEVKLDGVRALAIKQGSDVKLLSRAENDLTSRYPEIAAELSRLKPDQVVLDGEIVALDPSGRPSFQLLQACHSSAQRPPILYYAFDILGLEGRNVMGLPLMDRKRLLDQAIPAATGVIRISKGFAADAARIFRELQAQGFEGLVAKQLQSEYFPGSRNGAWLKYKWSLEQEFVIGGYTQPQGGRAHFGSLLVGYYQSDKLVYAGRVGTGFDFAELTALYRRFQALKTDACPFANLPERFPGGLTAGQMRRCAWVRPALVCQVRFTEWTRDHHLRQPSYLGLREDKSPGEVVREVA